MDNCATQKDNPPRNYPVSKVCNVEAPVGKYCLQNILIPIIQANDWLTTGFKFTYANIKEGEWNKTESREYLATMGIAEKISEHVES